MLTNLYRQSVDQDVVPPVSRHLLHLCVHFKYLRETNNKAQQNHVIYMYHHFASNVLDLGPEAGDLPHAVRYLPRGKALDHLDNNL